MAEYAMGAAIAYSWIAQIIIPDCCWSGDRTERLPNVQRWTLGTLQHSTWRLIHMAWMH